MTAHQRYLPYGRQTIDVDDIAAVSTVLRSQALTAGPAVAAFELAFAAKVGAAHAIACSSGTAALHLACLAMGLGPGDGLVVPALTFAATANCARFVDAEAVFADVNAETGLMEPQHFSAAIKRTVGSGVTLRAVCPVHLNGQSVEMGALAQLARAHGIAVIEDACHAIGTVDAPQGEIPAPTGACRHSRMTIFSLHPVKTITMGEGGVITTNDAELSRRLKRLRCHGIERDPANFSLPALGFDADGETNPWYYELSEVGPNYRASDIHCALGLSQLDKLDAFVARRRELAQHYDRLIAPLAPLVRPVGRVPWCRPAWHLYVALINFADAGVDRATVMRRLANAGIGSQVHYVPLYLQPYYRRRYGGLTLPSAWSYYTRCLSLPLYPAMTATDVDRVVTALAEALDGPGGH